MSSLTSAKVYVTKRQRGGELHCPFAIRMLLLLFHAITSGIGVLGYRAPLCFAPGRGGDVKPAL